MGSLEEYYEYIKGEKNNLINVSLLKRLEFKEEEKWKNCWLNKCVDFEKNEKKIGTISNNGKQTKTLSDKLMALCSAAIWDMTVKMVVPTDGNLDAIFILSNFIGNKKGHQSLDRWPS